MAAAASLMRVNAFDASAVSNQLLMIAAMYLRLQPRPPGSQLQLSFRTLACRGVDEHATLRLETERSVWCAADFYPSGRCAGTGPPFHTPTLALKRGASQRVGSRPFAPACQVQLGPIG